MSAVARSTWQRALHGPCKGLTRDVRMTLLACSEFMTRDGRLSRPEGDLAEYAEIEPRALARHRRAAVDAGWLTRESSGHHGRTAVYQATLPVTDDLQQRRQERAKPVTDDSQQADVASHYPTGYAPSKPVTDDSPSSKPSYGRTGAARTARFIFPPRTVRGRLAHDDFFEQANRSPVKHANPAGDSGPVLAGFGFDLALDRTLRGARS